MIQRRYSLQIVAALIALSAAFLATTSALAQESVEHTNLKVLDPNSSREEIGTAMLENLRGLGLPRRQSEGCLYCHVGSMDIPTNEWDFASDEKTTKEKARVMMQMVIDINSSYLPQLGDRIDTDFQVTCYTCHAGRTDPRPLATVIHETWSMDGIDAATRKYHELRDRYFSADAYDFRPAVLVGVANQLAKAGAWDDALAMAVINEKANAESVAASRARFVLELTRQLEERGVDQAVQDFDRKGPDERSGVVDYSVLDSLGWGLFRQQRDSDALKIFRKNVATYPNEYIPNESLGDALWFSGDQAAGIAVFEAWVLAHPDNDMGRRRLLNMREESGVTGN